MRAGVKIAFGTDQGVAPHGDNGHEFVYMVEAGMTPMAVIKSATIEAATLIGMEKDLGTVEAGKLADLVAVPGDPLADIGVMTVFLSEAGSASACPTIPSSCRVNSRRGGNSRL